MGSNVSFAGLSLLYKDLCHFICVQLTVILA